MIFGTSKLGGFGSPPSKLPTSLPGVGLGPGWAFGRTATAVQTRPGMALAVPHFRNKKGGVCSHCFGIPRRSLSMPPWALGSLVVISGGALAPVLASPEVLATREGPAWQHRRDLLGNTIETCLATQERPAWPHRKGLGTKDPGQGPGTRGQGPGTRVQGPGTRDQGQGPGTRDQGPGTRDQGLGARDQGRPDGSVYAACPDKPPQVP